MKKAALAVLMYVYTSLTSAAVINVEFKFTPFTGNAKQDEQVTTVAGKARVYLNNIFLAEQEVRQEKLPVLFEAREVAPSVWVPVASVGPALRRGRNTIRFDFEPGDAKASYRAQLRWAVVNDEATEQRSAGQVKVDQSERRRRRGKGRRPGSSAWCASSTRRLPQNTPGIARRQ
jgi:hypothetical protein